MNGAYKKILRVTLLFTLYPLSFLVRRKKKLWLFGCYSNLFADNAKYQYLWTTEYAKDIEAVWISGSKTVVEKLRAEGYTAYMRWSLSGIFAGLWAGVYVYSSYVDDINFYTSGRALRVNLWHGVGLKKIEFKIKEGYLKKYFDTSWWNRYRLLRPWQFARPDLFLSTSALMTDHFSECFRIPAERCFEGMYPRLTLHKDPTLMARALKFGPYDDIRETLKPFKRVLIYMPTWRDSQAGGIKKAIPDVAALNAALITTDTALVIKTHTNENLAKIEPASNIFIWDNSVDIYPMLNDFKGLITDYSSILYDYLAVGGRSIALYIYDFEDYINNSRDFAYSYHENVIGIKVYDFQELCKTCQHLQPQNSGICSDIIGKFWNSLDSGCDHIHKIIASKITRN